MPYPGPPGAWGVHMHAWTSTMYLKLVIVVLLDSQVDVYPQWSTLQLVHGLSPHWSRLHWYILVTDTSQPTALWRCTYPLSSSMQDQHIVYIATYVRTYPGSTHTNSPDTLHMQGIIFSILIMRTINIMVVTATITSITLPVIDSYTDYLNLNSGIKVLCNLDSLW